MRSSGGFPASAPTSARTSCRTRSPRGRMTTVLVCVLAGLMMTVAAIAARGTDLRADRTADLRDLIVSQGQAQHRAARRGGRAARGGRGAGLRSGRHRRYRRRAGPRRGEGRPGRGGGARRAGDPPGRAERCQARGGGRRRPRGAPARHPGRGQRAVGGRGRGDDHPGAARHLHHGDQVRGQHRRPARHPVRAALRDRGHRGPGACCWRRSTSHRRCRSTASTWTPTASATRWSGRRGSSSPPSAGPPASGWRASRADRPRPRRRRGGAPMAQWPRGSHPRDRQLRLVRLQHRVLPRADRRRGRGVAQRRPALRRARTGTPRSTACCCRPARARPRRQGCASTWCAPWAG